MLAAEQNNGPCIFPLSMCLVGCWGPAGGQRLCDIALPNFSTCQLACSSSCIQMCWGKVLEYLILCTLDCDHHYQVNITRAAVLEAVATSSVWALSRLAAGCTCQFLGPSVLKNPTMGRDCLRSARSLEPGYQRAAKPSAARGRLWGETGAAKPVRCQ